MQLHISVGLRIFVRSNKNKMEDFELSQETKTVGQIVKEYLRRHGYDGLVLQEEDCGCDLDDFEPCNQICSNCQAAYKHPYNEYGDFVLKTVKYVRLCVKCDCEIIDECGVFDTEDGPMCRGCYLEALQHGNVLAASGNYPVGTSGCFNVGISGGCGPDCFVYLNGECDEPEAMVERLEPSEIESHYELYPR